jgi:hypothetical protein
MADLPFCPRRYTNRPAIELAEKLVQITPDPLGKVLFAPGGTNAVRNWGHTLNCELNLTIPRRLERATPV